MQTLQPKWIRGKTIANVEMHPYDDGRGGKAYMPAFYFTDGSLVTFSVVETESLDSGIIPHYHARRKRRL